MNTPTATQIAQAVETYREDACGWNGVDDFAAGQFPRHPEAFQKALADAIRAAL